MNQQDNTVSVINAVTNSTVGSISMGPPHGPFPPSNGQIPVGAGPQNVAFTPDGKFAYVTNTCDGACPGTVSVIDTATQSVVGSPILVGLAPVSFGIFIGPNIIVAPGGPLSIANDAALSALGFGQFVDFNGGTLRTTGSLVTSRTISLLAQGGTIDTNGFDSLLSGTIIGTGGLTKLGAGTLTLSGISTYTGATTVGGGTLSVTGDISSSSGVTVNAGGALGGTGTVPGMTVNAGGVLAPGLPTALGALAVSGNLMLTSLAVYLVQVSPTGASKANVSGAATIGGTLALNATGGNYRVGTRYTLLTSAGARSGTFAGTTVTGSFGPGMKATVSYDAHDVYLTLGQLALILPSGLTQNQVNVANAINAFINSGSALPAGFENLFNLSPAQLAQALTQLGGQNNAGGGRQASFQLMNEFLLLMLNPFDADRSGLGSVGYGAGDAHFAPEQDRELAPDVAQAYAAVTPVDRRAVPFSSRWNVWASAFGGANNTNGDPTGVGSANFSARTGAVAAGLDYKVTPDTLIGFALAGGGTSWNLAQGLGGGHSDAFQAGLYGSQRFGPWYLSGAAAFANYWAATSRMISLPAIDTLNASFNAQSWGGRAEAGYRFAWGAINLAPYAALQAQSFATPNYSEASTSGSNQFALSYASRIGSAERAELGSWANTLYSLEGNAAMSLFGRAAWAHDWQNGPQAGATFLGLSPIASFIVSGAKPAADLAVITAGAEIRMATGWALMGKLDGEFGSGTQTYAGTARARYVW